MKKNQKINITFLAFGLLTLVGTYNALMINSESLISSNSSKNFKRLDEVLGVVKVGRQLAVSTDWRKVSEVTPKDMAASAPVIAKKVEAASVQTENTASKSAINTELDLKLVEVINAKKWEKGVKPSEFSGSIAANDGIIQSFTAALPGGHTIDISFSELVGNVFEYDLNGEVYTGMMYQADQNTYMVTLTNGPLEGTRLRFAGESVDSQLQAEEAQTYLAQNHNVEVGAFGEETEAPLAEVAVESAPQNVESASFNF